MLSLLIFITEFVLAPHPAAAHDYDMYRPDYPRSAFCVSVGNACVAETAVENSFYQNPAALTSGEEDWNFDGDISSHSNLEPGQNSRETEIARASGGVGYSTGKFGFALSFYRQRDKISNPLTITDLAGNTTRTAVNVRAVQSQLRIPFSYQVRPGFSVGIAFSLMKYTQNVDVANAVSGDPATSENTKFGFSVGMNYHFSEKLHYGFWFRPSRTLTQHLNIVSRVGSATLNYQEDMGLHYPWILANGVEYHLRDDLILFGEADVIGPTTGGRLLDYYFLGDPANGRDSKVDKGHFVVVESHLGARYFLTRRLKLHGGTYFEPARTENTHGRFHGTGGISYLFSEWFELIAGFDAAKDFSQFLLSFR